MNSVESKTWTRDDVDKLVHGFEECTLTESEWTHHAHLVVSASYLINLEYYEAILKLKLGIARFNESLGNKNTIERGYHETITLFWNWAIQGYINNFPKEDPVDLINSLLKSPFANKYLPFFFYTEDLLFSRKARVMWTEPDIRALDLKLITNEYPSSIWFSS